VRRRWANGWRRHGHREVAAWPSPEEGEEGAGRVGPNDQVGRMTGWAGRATRIGRRDGPT
jgi:hypothetical protein